MTTTLPPFEIPRPPSDEPIFRYDKPRTLGAMARLAASIPTDGRSVKLVNHEVWDDFTYHIEVEIGATGPRLLRVLAVILSLASIALAAFSLR